MKSSQQFFISIILLVMFASCNKKQEIPTTSTYKLINRNGRQITIDIYGSKADYGTNANRISRDVVQPDNHVSKTLDVGKTYWVDWYSDDYSLNNWTKYELQSAAPELNIAMVNDTVSFSNLVSDTLRSVMLNGSSIASVWQGSTNAPGFAGIYRFTFRKDFTGEYDFTGADGIRTTTTFNYLAESGLSSPSSKQGFTLALIKTGTTLSADFYAYWNTGSASAGFTSDNGRDSLRMYKSLGLGGVQFFAVRQ